jgi:GTPase SAR1 family protein
MTTIPTIFLVGEVSSGKSSFLNSLAGAYVANASLQRETLKPNLYRFLSDGDSIEVNKETKYGGVARVNKITESLEEDHKENEELRDSIENADIAKINNICDESNGLPIGFGLGAFNVIDFPGINDAEDKTGKFLNIIKENIKSADLILYLTDASTAFQRETELKSFEILCKMVREENKDGHYVDIIIIVNKFDDLTCPDLNQIYDRIPRHSSLEKEKVLRFSSHKMMITNIVTNKKTLYVPEFARRELKRILKTSSVIVTPRLNKSLNSTGKIPYDYITFEEELDTFDDDKSISSSSSTDVEDVKNLHHTMATGIALLDILVCLVHICLRREVLQ